jgi:hypothetical protein
MTSKNFRDRLADVIRDPQPSSDTRPSYRLADTIIAALKDGLLLPAYLEGDYQPPLMCDNNDCGEILLFCDAGTSFQSMLDAVLKHQESGECSG